MRARIAAGIGGLAFIALIGIAFVGVNVARSPSKQLYPAPVSVDAPADAPARLARALTWRTETLPDGTPRDPAAFGGLYADFTEDYPSAHAVMTREPVAAYSVLYTWPGSDRSLPPMVLLAHVDVVPVEPGTEGDWQHPPYAGVIADGYIWGRGALDDKQNALAALEAIEQLLENGFSPTRTVMLALGHDEEVGGSGARAIAERVRASGVVPYLVLDEGGVRITNALAGLDAPAALIGVAEKGSLSLTLTATSDGGHSSMPPPSTAAGRIGAAVAAMEANPMPARISGVAGQMLDWLGPEMRQPMRTVFANRALLAPVIVRQMSGKPSSNAILRTTTAVTMLEGSVKENVLPQRATATINFRVLPGDTIADVVAHTERVVAPYGVRVAVMPGIQSEPSGVSPASGPAFDDLARVIRELHPDTVVAPYLMLGATDARHWSAFVPATYRYSPAPVDSDDLGRLHGTNERISVEGYLDTVRFYTRIITVAAGDR